MPRFDSGEKRIIKNIDLNRSERSRNDERILVEEAYGKARILIDKEALNPEDFIHEKEGYTEDEVRVDLEKVAREEIEDEKNNSTEQKELKKRADIFEAIIHDQIGTNEWFGADAHAIKPSYFDDRVNKVDEVVAIETSEEMTEHLALAIDVTFSSAMALKKKEGGEKGNHITTKIKKIRKDINDGKLGRIKYFSSTEVDERGNKKKVYGKDVPRFVVGAEYVNVEELLKLWIDDGTEQLKRHPIQMLILEEIAMQAVAFGKYARQQGQVEISNAYKKVEVIIEKIRDGKRIEGLTGGKLRDGQKGDAVFLRIKEELDF